MSYLKKIVLSVVFAGLMLSSGLLKSTAALAAGGGQDIRIRFGQDRRPDRRDWYRLRREERDELRRVREQDRDRRLRYQYNNRIRIVGFYDQFGNFHQVGYYDRWGFFHRV